MRDAAASPLGRFRDYVSPRQWAIDANDGIIAAAGLLEGFSSSGAAEYALETAASAMMIAGAFAIGGAKWSEAASELDAERQIIAAEAAELAENPERELTELARLWEERGLDPELAWRVTQQLSATDPLAAQLEFEHDIDRRTPHWQPVWAGATSGIAFFVGALVPLLITVLAPVQTETWVIIVAVALSLLVCSVIAARSGGMSVRRTIGRSLVFGIGTLLFSAIVGSILF